MFLFSLRHRSSFGFISLLSNLTQHKIKQQNKLNLRTKFSKMPMSTSPLSTTVLLTLKYQQEPVSVLMAPGSFIVLNKGEFRAQNETSVAEVALHVTGFNTMYMILIHIWFSYERFEVWTFWLVDLCYGLRNIFSLHMKFFFIYLFYFEMSFLWHLPCFASCLCPVSQDHLHLSSCVSPVFHYLRLPLWCFPSGCLVQFWLFVAAMFVPPLFGCLSFKYVTLLVWVLNL